MTTKLESLVERAVLGGAKVDRANGVIRAVKIVGRHSSNGREYTREALSTAVSLYDGARVNVDHPASGGPNAVRSYADRIGHLANVQSRDDGLYADLHYNPKHALGEQLAWDAEHAPQNVGLSHNVMARTTRRGAKTVVEAIERVVSVDLVADPASVAGLYEGVGGGTAFTKRDAIPTDRKELAEWLTSWS